MYLSRAKSLFLYNGRWENTNVLAEWEAREQSQKQPEATGLKFQLKFQRIQNCTVFFFFFKPVGMQWLDKPKRHKSLSVRFIWVRLHQASLDVTFERGLKQNANTEHLSAELHLIKRVELTLECQKKKKKRKTFVKTHRVHLSPLSVHH